MKPIVLALPGNDAVADRLATASAGERGTLSIRSFPDGESLVRIGTPVAGRAVMVVCGLDRPDPKLVPLLFTLENARELGAARVGLVAPYLCYLRQDRAFHEGEAVAARLFARVLSRSLDWLVTVDPHLHRIHDLSEVYPVPSVIVHAAPAIADWVRRNVERPLFVGPDAESEPWVSDVAERAGAPWIVLEETRGGDRALGVRVPQVDPFRDRVPVLVQDIVSSGSPLLATVGHLRAAGLPPPIAVAVHGLFADRSDEALAAAGATVVTTTSIPHPTNRIDLVPLLGEAIRELVR